MEGGLRIWGPGDGRLREPSSGLGSPCLKSLFRACVPRPPNVPLLRALWSLLDPSSLKGSWGVLVGCPS